MTLETPLWPLSCIITVYLIVVAVVGKKSNWKSFMADEFKVLPILHLKTLLYRTFYDVKFSVFMTLEILFSLLWNLVKVQKRSFDRYLPCI